ERLPAIYREPLVLHYLEGLSREGTATRLGVPASTVKIRLERGRKRLEAALQLRGVSPGIGLLALAVASGAVASSRLAERTVDAATGRVPITAAVGALAKPALGGRGWGLVLSGMVTILAAALVIAAVGAGQPQTPKPVAKTPP